ncbi:hypothetical protein LCGC14_0806250 [marine sediment metagenome]|uniref:Uncharacterized protein n=1 Tax=marine sediment metagenome TaxID=412755 RepID=A0A0F9PN41_9ZZZZ
MKNLIKKVSSLIMIFILLSGSFQFFLNHQIISILKFNNEDKIHSSGQISYSKEWLKNNNFSTQDEWNYTKGQQGDNSTVGANISVSNEWANYKVLGENNTYNLLTGDLNLSTWSGWGIYNNSDFLLPDVTEINATGLYVYHYLDESEGPNSQGQVHNFPSVHFRKNISLPVDMSDYEIKSASIESMFNASVAPTVDTQGDTVDFYSIWDSATFYLEISDLNLSYSFRVAQNKTTNLGQDSPPVLNITDRALDTLDESDMITALNLALEKDPNHSSFTIILGIDIYCEDNLGSGGGDRDEWYALIFKSLNLTFTYEKKIDQFSSVSWYQIGNIISGLNLQISEAQLTFKVKIGQLWPALLSPFSEMSILINDNLYTETLRLGTLNTTFDIIMFDVSSLILKDVNITLEIQVFIANTFSLGKNITISIDDVFLNISYYNTFPDYTTDIDLFLNFLNKTQDKVIQIPINNILNVTIKYTNQSTGLHIPNATVQLGGDFSGYLNENLTLEQYSIIFNSSQLGIGIKTLTVEAKNDNFITQTIQFFVTVVERATELLLFVDNNQIDDGDTVNSGVNEFLKIAANFRDNSTKKFLSGASVELLSVDNLTETINYYNITINTNELDQGINVLIIHTYLSNYTSQTFQFFIELIEGTSELLLFVNNTPTYNSDTVTVKTEETLDIAVFYRDNLTKTHLSGANVELLSVGNFIESGGSYNITINTNDLNPGTTILTITAQINNYLSQTIRIYVELFERATELHLYLNSENKTLDPVIELPIGSILNITAKYTENQTRRHLNNATIRVIGENFLTSLTENLAREHYSILINTTILKVGVNLLSIIANTTNYQIATIDIRITINKISTVISTVSGVPIINILPGDNVKLQIILNNSDFGAIIKNATVTYTWTYGHDELTDQDNDGIYEADLLEIPEGTYTIIITASAGDYYDFKNYEITVSAIRGPTEDQTWLIYVLSGGIVGLVSIFSVYQLYFKYPPLVRKIRKLRKSIRKGKKTKPMIISKREETIKIELQNQAKILDLESENIENKIPDKIEKISKNTFKESE